MTAYESLLKVLLVGDSGVGKTSAIQKHCFNRFPENHDKSLIVNFHRKSYNLKNSTDLIDVLYYDCPGRKCLNLLSEEYYYNSVICVVFFSTDDKESFDNVPNWIDAVKERSRSAQIILVENKMDLYDQTKLDSFETEKLSKTYDVPLFRISVKENLNTSNLFSFVLDILKNHYMASMNSLPRGYDAFFVGGEAKGDDGEESSALTLSLTFTKKIESSRNKNKNDNKCIV